MTKTTQRLAAQYELGWPYFPVIRDVTLGLQNAGADLDMIEGRGHLSKVFYLSGNAQDVLRCVFKTKMGVVAVKGLSADLC